MFRKAEKQGAIMRDGKLTMEEIDALIGSETVKSMIHKEDSYLEFLKKAINEYLDEKIDMFKDKLQNWTSVLASDIKHGHFGGIDEQLKQITEFEEYRFNLDFFKKLINELLDSDIKWEKLEKEKTKENDEIEDDEYTRKMVKKFHAEGWSTENIAKELQIAMREVDFILKQ